MCNCVLFSRCQTCVSVLRSCRWKRKEGLLRHRRPSVGRRRLAATKHQVAWYPARTKRVSARRRYLNHILGEHGKPQLEKDCLSAPGPSCLLGVPAWTGFLFPHQSVWQPRAFWAIRTNRPSLKRLPIGRFTRGKQEQLLRRALPRRAAGGAGCLGFCRSKTGSVRTRRPPDRPARSARSRRAPPSPRAAGPKCPSWRTFHSWGTVYNYWKWKNWQSFLHSKITIWECHDSECGTFGHFSSRLLLCRHISTNLNETMMYDDQISANYIILLGALNPSKKKPGIRSVLASIISICSDFTLKAQPWKSFMQQKGFGITLLSNATAARYFWNFQSSIQLNSWEKTTTFFNVK